MKPCVYCPYKTPYCCPCNRFMEWQKEQEKEVLQDKKTYSYEQKYNET